MEDKLKRLQTATMELAIARQFLLDTKFTEFRFNLKLESVRLKLSACIDELQELRREIKEDKL